MKNISLIVSLLLCVVINAQPFNQISSNINPGSWGGSNPSNFIQLNNDLIFTAYNSSASSWNTTSLYKSDGTLSGTSLIMDISPCITQSNENYIVNANNNLFFKKKTSSTYIEQLWKSDGTFSGTVLIKDLDTKEFCSNLCEMNGSLFFMTKYVDLVWGNTVHELWKSDGTISGTVSIKDWTNSGYGSSINIREFNNKIYFSGNESDGTLSGTILTGVNLPSIKTSSILNGEIYYSGTGGKLWKTDGTLTGTIQAVDFPAAGNFYTSNGWIYFAGGLNGAGSAGIELCRTDGTSLNTTVIKDIYFGYNSSYPNDFLSFNGDIFFTADDGIHGTELWKTDGTSAGTALVKDIFAGNNGINRFDKIIHDNQFYFSTGVRDNEDINGIYKSDGTELNTLLVQPMDSIGSFIEINCNLFVNAVEIYDGLFKCELYSNLSTCPPADLSDLSGLSNLLVYPNPTSSEVKITLTQNQVGKTFKVYDNIGREKMTGVFNSTQYTLHLESFEAGIYFLKIADEDAQIKIIKN